ncbi:MAG TPA: histidine kinase dimerization/phospho-acceptor domain-containing protein [Terriglobales bacterium]|nr:histidine kinase dimerization/phospho-acceptor domain-containing protein [Terriglobales bacterium]
MSSLLDKLPTILVLCVLLGIFVSLRKHAPSRTVRLWIVGWALILAHFIAQAFDAAPGWRGQFASVVELAGLELAGTVFVASTWKAIFDSRRRLCFFFLLLVPPVLAHSILAGIPLDLRWPYLATMGAIFFGSTAFLLRVRRPLPRFGQAVAVFLPAIGCWSIHDAWYRNYDTGTLAVLALGYMLAGVNFYRIYQRRSPGVTTTALGFFFWGAVFPVGALTDHFLPHVAINPEIWNVPKYFVAFGMILTLLEDKSFSLLAVNAREHQANRQLQYFSQITSRLLTGADPKLMCPEIARVITQFSNFRRVAVNWENEEGKLEIAGESGLSPQASRELRDKVQHWTGAHIAEMSSLGQPLGSSSILIKYRDLASFDPVRSVEQFPPNPIWENGDEVIVPLRSSTGRCLGCISLDDPKDVTRVSSEEMSKIELLAADLSVSFENAALQQQLIRSEKLAAIGKLVSGVAHELNNPLTSISGFSELLLEEVQPENARKKLEKISHESRRMQRIIDNLLRFARGKTIEQTPLDLQLVLREALALFEYKLRSERIELRTSIDPTLPRIVGDEGQMKQVFVNLMGNALDAIDGMTERRISIEMFARHSHVVIRFADSGKGFSDLNRAFDPFYTTKPVGKGPGLGLSICYGLIKEHGGEIRAENLQPGAVVIIELPRAQSRPLALSATTNS